VRELELAPSAEADLSDVLVRSQADFGNAARLRYEALIERALQDIQVDPTCAGSTDRSELGRGVRTYHLRHCRGRARIAEGSVKDPRHMLVYEFDDLRVVVLRLLHDSMDLGRHVGG
jgi:toxin ParE1/3/4